MPGIYPRYEEDYYGWIQATAALLKQGNFREVDMDHVIEEMEDMGKREKRSFTSRMAQLIAHLLKWEYQPSLRSKSWTFTIQEQRDQLKELYEENPSFRSQLEGFMAQAYKHGLNIFRMETHLETSLPQKCPYTFDQCLDDTFFPSGDQR